VQRGSLLGPSFDRAAVRACLDAAGARYTAYDDEGSLHAAVVELLASGKVVARFDGPMEFGPRALGNRSILADPRDPSMQKTLNLRVKLRESFRPFAPACLEEHAGDYFELDRPSPYMLLVAPVSAAHRRPLAPGSEALQGLARLDVERSDIPAVTHVDGTARIQTVAPEPNPRFHALLRAFHERTGCPVLINTSFNLRGEPVVCTPEDAWRCFAATDIDALLIGDHLCLKADQRLPESSRRTAPAALD
jgi:carbamoyltransferase